MQTIKVIITGEKSFVGKNLVKFFKKKKIYYNTYSDFKKSTNQNQFTHLIHISFQKNCNNSNLDSFINKNISRTKKIIKMCEKKNINLIFLSTSSYYPNNKKSKENDKLFCYDLYSTCKILCEKLILRSKLKNYLILRISNIYGKGGNSYIEKLLKIKKNKKKTIYENKNTIRDFIFINDLLLVISKFLQTKISKEIYNVGSGKGYNLYKLYDFAYKNKLISKIEFNKVNFTPPRPFYVANINKLEKRINLKLNHNLLMYIKNEFSIQI